jgi:hypothetical protein
VSCDSIESAILFNDTATPIRVTLSNPRSTSEQGLAQPCLSDPPVARPASSERDIQNAYWQEIRGLQADPVKCQYVFTLEPGFAALLETGGRCDRAAANAFAALIIEGPQKRVEWHGPDAAAQFKRHGGFCSYHFK